MSGPDYGEEHQQLRRTLRGFVDKEITPFVEGDVLRLIAQGQSNKRIAAVLEVSPETVKSHVKNIFVKLGVDNRMQAVTSGRRQGYFE